MSDDEKTQWALTKKEAKELRVLQDRKAGLNEAMESLTRVAEMIARDQMSWWVDVANAHNIPPEKRPHLKAVGSLVRYVKNPYSAMMKEA